MQSRAQELPFIGICDSLANLIKVKDGYEVCAEIAMGNNAQDIIIESEEQLFKAIEHIDNQNLGRVNFLVLDKINKLEIELDANLCQQTLGPLSDFIEVNERYTSIVKYVARNTYVVNDSAEAKNVLENTQVNPKNKDYN